MDRRHISFLNSVREDSPAIDHREKNVAKSPPDLPSLSPLLPCRLVVANMNMIPSWETRSAIISPALNTHTNANTQQNLPMILSHISTILHRLPQVPILHTIPWFPNSLSPNDILQIQTCRVSHYPLCDLFT